MVIQRSGNMPQPKDAATYSQLPSNSNRAIRLVIMRYLNEIADVSELSASMMLRQ